MSRRKQAKPRALKRKYCDCCSNLTLKKIIAPNVGECYLGLETYKLS